MADEPDDGQLDGCSLDFDDPERNTADDTIDALVLFADVDFTDPEAVAAREVEWRELLA